MNSPIEKDNILLEGTSQLTTEQKKLFKYFGVGTKIKPPFRILNPQRIYLGDKTSIQEHCHINAFVDLRFLMDFIKDEHRSDFNIKDYQYDSSIHIDRECQVGRFFFVSCTNSIRINNNVLISERVFIGDNNHSFSNKYVPVMQQPNKKGKPIEIQEGCWIGVGAAILQGTSLGINAVVSTNSVVEGVFPSYSVIGNEKAKLLYRLHEKL